MEEFQIGFTAIVAVLAFIAIWIIFYFIPVGLWFSALVSGVHMSLLQLVLMHLLQLFLEMFQCRPLWLEALQLFQQLFCRIVVPERPRM